MTDPEFFTLPARFFHPGNPAFMGQLPECDSGQFKFSHISAGRPVTVQRL
ncbi:Hypothetical protein ACI5QL_00939 [Bacillus velezensis]